jgi:hypothetical protein
MEGFTLDEVARNNKGGSKKGNKSLNRRSGSMLIREWSAQLSFSVHFLLIMSF